MSELLNIIDRVAAMPLIVPSINNGAAIPAWNLGGGKTKAERTDLPVRVILPIGYPAFQAGFSVPNPRMGHQGRVQVTWQITELFLLQSKGQGRGTAKPWLELAQMCAAYANELAKIRKPTDRSEITSWFLDNFEGEFPENSGNFYYGLLNSITVLERLC